MLVAMVGKNNMSKIKELSVILLIAAIMMPTVCPGGVSEGVSETELYTLSESNNVFISDSIGMIELDRSLEDTINEKLISGRPVVSIGSLNDLGTDVCLIRPSVSCDASGIYYNESLGVSCVFEANGDNALDNAIEWANNIESEVLERGYGGDGDYLWFDECAERDNFKLYVRTDFHRLGVAGTETYYSIHHYVNPIVKNTSDGRETSSVVVEGDLSNYPFCRLLNSSPSDSPVPDYTGTISVGVSGGMSGFTPSVSASLSLSWDFTIKYCTIDNDTDLSDGIYHIDFDYNEMDFDIDDSMLLEPGAAVAVNSNSILAIDFYFSMSVCQRYTQHLWIWDPYWEYRTIEITQTAMINPGAN